MKKAYCRYYNEDVDTETNCEECPVEEKTTCINMEEIIDSDNGEN